MLVWEEEIKPLEISSKLLQVCNLPSKEASIPTAVGILRNDKFKYNDTTWRVVGYDKESITGVMYITLEEDYENGELPNSNLLTNWSFTTNQGKDIILTTNVATIVEFKCWYAGKEVNRGILISSSNITFTKIDNNHYSLLAEENGTFDIKVELIDSTEIYEVIPITVVDVEQDWIAISGPKILKVMETQEFTLDSSLENYSVNITSKYGYFSVDSVNGLNVQITGQSIGKDSIVITYNSASFEIPLEIISLWM